MTDSFQPTHQITIVYQDGAIGHMPVMLDANGFALTHRQWADAATSSPFRHEEHRWVITWPRGALSVIVERRTPKHQLDDELAVQAPPLFAQGDRVELLTHWAHDSELAWFSGYTFAHYETEGTTAIVYHSDGPFQGSPVRQTLARIRRARS